jgi:hypothetical protein
MLTNIPKSRPRRPAALAVAGMVVAALAAGPALAQVPGAPAPRSAYDALTAADLAMLCNAPQSVPDSAAAIAFCHGFLQGAGQYHAVITQPGSGNRPVFCPPTPAPTRGEAARAFGAWLDQHPQYASDRAVDGLARWAAAAYPCPTPPPAPTRRATR